MPKSQLRKKLLPSRSHRSTPPSIVYSISVLNLNVELDDSDAQFTLVGGTPLYFIDDNSP